jgi:hypothetical protein
MKLRKIPLASEPYGFAWMVTGNAKPMALIYRWDGTPFGPGELPAGCGAMDLEAGEYVDRFDTPSQMIGLITPTLVELAKRKIKEHDSSALHGNAGRALRMEPYVNAVWILRSTPDEIDRWSRNLQRAGCR